MMRLQDRFRTVRERAGSFSSNAGGNVLMLFAMAIIPIFGLLGLAVDYTYASSVRSHLHNALDATALAVARSLDKSEAERMKLARSFMDSNLPKDLKGIPIDLDVNTETGRVVVTSDYNVPTTFLSVIGVDTIEVGNFSEVQISQRDLELALVLDTTGSMKTHMPALRTAARELLETVYAGQASLPNVRAAVVPYIATVNLGNAPGRMEWMDRFARAKYHGENFENFTYEDIQSPGCKPKPKPKVDPPKKPDDKVAEKPKTDPKPQPKPKPKPKRGGSDLGYVAPDLLPPSATNQVVATLDHIFSLIGPASAEAKSGCEDEFTKVNHFDLFDEIRNASWGGCVELRPEPYDVRDTPPSTGVDDTLWVPYFWPDERDGESSIRNDYTADDLPAKYKDDVRGRQAWFKKYDNATITLDESSFLGSGPNFACPDEIEPLTTNRTRLDTHIQGLTSYGGSGTNAAIGMAWGWRVLSPAEPFSQGKAYDPENLDKVIVLMTDGLNEMVEQSNWWNRSDYSAIGYASKRRYGTDDSEKIRERIDSRLEEVCENAKDEDVIVYTVLFDPATGGALSSAQDKLFRECASSDDHFFKADSQSKLISAFNAIAGDLVNLRLTR